MFNSIKVLAKYALARMVLSLKAILPRRAGGKDFLAADGHGYTGMNQLGADGSWLFVHSS